MKQTTYIIGFLLILTSCHSSFEESEEIIETYPNGQAELVVRYLNSDSTSFIHRCYYESGKLKSESIK